MTTSQADPTHTSSFLFKARCSYELFQECISPLQKASEGIYDTEILEDSYCRVIHLSLSEELHKQICVQLYLNWI